MTEVSGVIQKIESRKVANGTKTAYDIFVGGQKYGAGLWAPIDNKTPEKRKRGRPKGSKNKVPALGSKNKPKRPITATEVVSSTASKLSTDAMNRFWEAILHEEVNPPVVPTSTTSSVITSSSIPSVWALPPTSVHITQDNYQVLMNMWNLVTDYAPLDARVVEELARRLA